MTPLAIDLFCGLGGWTESLQATGFRVVGFDLERHVYGEHAYPGQLVLQDVRTLHGRQFKDAALIVASPPCQKFSYMAMPWRKAKQMIREYEDGTRDRKELTALFDACFRIQREASEAAGHHIPMVVENVRGAQRWVGRARWHFGSYYLWGDVPALMPITHNRLKGGQTNWRDHDKAGYVGQQLQDHFAGVKVPTMGASWYPPGHPKPVPGLAFNGHAERATKNTGGSWFNVAHNTTSGHGQNHDGRRTAPGKGARFTSREDGRKAHPGGKDGWFGDYQMMKDGIKQHGSGREWFVGDGKISRMTSSKSPARRAASALIAKIPAPLALHIARTFFQVETEEGRAHGE